MLRKALVIVAVAAISVFSLSGCKKGPSEAERGEEVVKTKAEYEADAKKKINKKNMVKELEKLEKEIEHYMQPER